MHRLARLDLQYVWHPFTQMRDWLRHEPTVITAGHGAVLRDAHGREYLDANSSIWTNLHGHNNPAINAAIQRQLRRIAHSSALGLANEPASLLARRLVQAANPGTRTRRSCTTSGKAPSLARVFFSDNGSTALEVALKLAHETARRTGLCRKPRFLSLSNAYHGDTVGAVSVGQIYLFRRCFTGLLFKSDAAMAPYCYRCPYNGAKPERADARAYRRCHWECLEMLDRHFAARKRRAEPYAAFVFEPLIQGAAGMIPQPGGWLRKATAIARDHGALLIADEVMTGFGRTGKGTSDNRSRETPGPTPRQPRPGTECLPLFACQHENVQPDFLALAKGLSGGYVPLAATLATESVFNAFLGEYAEFKTFFHGHSFTGNQLGAAAALASLDLLQSRRCSQARVRLEKNLSEQLDRLWQLPQVGDARQVGLIAGIELVRNWRTREPFDLRERAGIRVCEAMARRGVLTRPIGNVIVLMPPYCTTSAQLEEIVDVLRSGIQQTLPMHQ